MYVCVYIYYKYTPQLATLTGKNGNKPWDFSTLEGPNPFIIGRPHEDSSAGGSPHWCRWIIERCSKPSNCLSLAAALELVALQNGRGTSGKRQSVWPGTALQCSSMWFISFSKLLSNQFADWRICWPLLIWQLCDTLGEFGGNYPIVRQRRNLSHVHTSVHKKISCKYSVYIYM